MRSPLGDPVRSESVAGMDMLNDMFQRQARRLESQLYQRAQDQRTIEVTQRQAQIARAQVRQLEQTHLEQAARISQGAKSLQRLQELIRETLHVKQEVLSVCEELERDAAALREALERAAPGEAGKIRLRQGCAVSVEGLRARARSLENALSETERSALQQIGVTPLTSVAMSSDCNPLNDLSAVADYASKASVVDGGAVSVAAAPASAAVHSPPLPPPPPPLQPLPLPPAPSRLEAQASTQMHVPVPMPMHVPALGHTPSTSTSAPMAMSPRFASTAPYAASSLIGDHPVPMSLSRDPSFEQRPF